MMFCVWFGHIRHGILESPLAHRLFLLITDRGLFPYSMATLSVHPFADRFPPIKENLPPALQKLQESAPPTE